MSEQAEQTKSEQQLSKLSSHLSPDQRKQLEQLIGTLRGEIRTEDLAYEARLGQKYSTEFIEMMAEHAQGVLLDWLKANHLPDQVVNLVETAVMLERISQEKRTHTLPDIDAVYLAQELPGITETIAAMGGEYSGPYSNITGRGPLKWEYLEQLQAVAQAAGELTLRAAGVWFVNPEKGARLQAALVAAGIQQG
jgi:hypothetical protein